MLNLKDTKISDKSIKLISNLQGIEEISLAYTIITDKSVNMIASGRNWTSVKKVNLEGCRMISDEAVNELISKRKY